MTISTSSSAKAYDESKLTELIIYVSKQLFGKNRNGSVKLNKILFFSDTFAYKLLGKPITGVEYIRRRFGPAPKGITALQHRLSDSNDIEVLVSTGLGRSQTIIFPKRDADLKVFSAQEIKMVDLVIEALSGMKTDDVSELSHSLDGWQFAREGEPIPYETIFLYSGPITQSDVRMGIELEARLKSDIDERVRVLDHRHTLKGLADWDAQRRWIIRTEAVTVWNALSLQELGAK